MNYNPWYGVTKEEAEKHMKENAVDNVAANTSIADYVWLPLRFREPSEEYPNGMVYIDWHDEWKIEDYE